MLSDPTSKPALTERALTRLAEIRADISARLWPVNAGMSREAFNDLMDQMSRLQLRFELRAAVGTSGKVDTRMGTGDRRSNPDREARDAVTPDKEPTPE